MALPLEKNLAVYIGSDFSENFRMVDENSLPVDLTGYSIKSQIKEKQSQDASLIETFNISVAATDGGFTLSLTDTQTSAITKKVGYYDVLLTDGDSIDTYAIFGQVTFVPTVTVKA
jgi:hypothetical protein